MYSTDNGPHRNSWPDGAHDAVPQREEHQLGRRLPHSVVGALAGQDQGRQRSRTRSSSITTGSRPSSPWPASPTSSRRPRRATRRSGAPTRTTSTATTSLPYLTGKEKESPRKGFVYISDDGDIIALRYDNWKMVFMEQRCHGTLQVWAEPFTRLRLPKIYNLRTDPYEFADVTSNTYYEWFIRHVLHRLWRAVHRRPVRCHVQGLPADPEAEQPSRSTMRSRRCIAPQQAADAVGRVASASRRPAQPRCDLEESIDGRSGNAATPIRSQADRGQSLRVDPHPLERRAHAHVVGADVGGADRLRLHDRAVLRTPPRDRALPRPFGRRHLGIWGWRSSRPVCSRCSSRSGSTGRWCTTCGARNTNPSPDWVTSSG